MIIDNDGRILYDRHELPSRYWEIGWEDADDEEPDEEREPNYDEEELPFC